MRICVAHERCTHDARFTGGSRAAAAPRNPRKGKMCVKLGRIEVSAGRPARIEPQEDAFGTTSRMHLGCVYDVRVASPVEGEVRRRDTRRVVAGPGNGSRPVCY